MKSLMVAVILAMTSAAFGAEASYKHWQSVVKEAKQAHQNRDFDKARFLLEGAAAEAATLSKENSAENSFLLGYAILSSGEVDQALATADEALEKLGPNPRAPKQQAWRGELLVLKAEALRRGRRADEAIAAATEGKKVWEMVGGKFHPQLFFLDGLIGEIYAQKKNYAEAEKAYRSALKQAESRPIQTVNEWSGAESQLTQYSFEGSNAGALQVSTALGDLMMEQEKVKEAEEFYLKSLKLAEQKYGKKHQAIVLPLEGLARVHLKTDRRKDFEKDVERTYEVSLKEPGLEPWVANPLWLKLEVDLKDGNSAAVKQTARKINEVFAKQNFDSKWMANGVQRASFRHKTNDWGQVGELQKVFRESAMETYASAPAKAGGLLLGFGEASVKAGKLDLARVNYEELVKLGEKTGEKMLQVGAMGKLADLSIAEKKHEEALATLQKITTILKEKYGDDSRVASAMSREAATLKAMGRDKEAAEMEASAQEVLKKSFLKR